MSNELDGSVLGALPDPATDEEKAAKQARDEHVAVLALSNATSIDDALDLLDALDLADAARSWHRKRVGHAD
jgi:hypothetical protein